MNRFELEFASIEPAPPAGTRQTAPVIFALLPAAAASRSGADSDEELITRRRPAAGTSVRRLRNRRSLWPRRS